MSEDIKWREPLATPLESVLALIKATFCAALVASLLALIIVGLILGKGSAGVMVALYGGIIHSGSMLVVGLPFYLYAWPRPWLSIWMPAYALPVGAFLSVVPLLFIL
ncbi:hypothetical protein [Rubritalea sp.]|uniref:hypothetical protein n=1 Tax=Rubritalea sp. TaxID=2109375 RepID=UPI003EF97A45